MQFHNSLLYKYNYMTCVLDNHIYLTIFIQQGELHVYVTVRDRINTYQPDVGRSIIVSI